MYTFYFYSEENRSTESTISADISENPIFPLINGSSLSSNTTTEEIPLSLKPNSKKLLNLSGEKSGIGDFNKEKSSELTFSSINKVPSKSNSMTTIESDRKKDEGDNGFERITKIEVPSSIEQQNTQNISITIKKNMKLTTNQPSIIETTINNEEKSNEKFHEIFVESLEGNFFKINIFNQFL